MMLKILFIYAVSWECTFSQINIAQLSSGKIKGKFLSNGNGTAFLGIPYARPPIGNQRYKPPLPNAPWLGVMDCTQYRKACMQNSSMSSFAASEENLSEDCLFVIVIRGVDCHSASPCPVLHIIHGGSWYFDSPTMFRPETLYENFASKGIVLVTVGYRLGTFGFWHVANHLAIGNSAVYDMVESLKWTQREIHNFGGDPHKVTLMGYSSGARAVSQLSLSNRVDGLFHQLILMSGSAFGTPFKDSVYVSRTFARECGCATEEPWETQNLHAIVDCMKKKQDPFELLSVQSRLFHAGETVMYLLADARRIGTIHKLRNASKGLFIKDVI